MAFSKNTLIFILNNNADNPLESTTSPNVHEFDSKQHIMWRHRQQRSQSKGSPSLTIRTTQPPLQTTGGQHVRPRPMTAPFLHSTMESHSLVNTGRVGQQHSTSSRKQTIPHISCPGDSSQPPTKSPSLTLSRNQQGSGWKVRTITYGHCFPNDSGWEFLKLLRSVWRSFLKLYPKVGKALYCSKQIPGLCLHPTEKQTIK